MLKHIINQIIITVGQYRQFGGKENEQQFERLLGQLQKVTGKTQEQAIQMLYDMAGIVEEDAA